MNDEIFTAAFVPEQASQSTDELVSALSDKCELLESQTAGRTGFRFGDAIVICSSVDDPPASFLVVRGPTPSATDSALAMLEETFSRASLEHLRSLAEDGNPLLWAVAEQGNPRPDDVEKHLWEQLGSPDYEERLLAAEAARMLASPGAMLGIECCALVELGPIRTVFESHLNGTHRRRLPREGRVLLDPATPLPDQLETIHKLASEIPGVSISSSVGYASTYFQWRGETDWVYVVDADHPSVRWLGFDGPNTQKFRDISSYALPEALGKAPEDADWVRAAANVATVDDADLLLSTLDELKAAGTSSFQLVFAAIESANPNVWSWAIEHRAEFDDRLLPIIEAAGLLGADAG